MILFFKFNLHLRFLIFLNLLSFWVLNYSNTFIKLILIYIDIIEFY